MTENTDINSCLDEIEVNNTFNKNSNVNYETVSNSTSEFSNKWSIPQVSDLHSIPSTSAKCYIDSNNIVRIRGLDTATVTKSTAFLLFNLPSQFRPTSALILPISVLSNWNTFPQPFSTNRFFITINTNGDVTINTNHMVTGFTSVAITIRMDNFIQYNKNI